MSWLSDIRALKGSEFYIALGIVVAVIGPGFLVLLLYRPDLLISLDILKLIVLSAGGTLPFLVLNFCATSYSQKPRSSVRGI
jgi:hypothetical protein